MSLLLITSTVSLQQIRYFLAVVEAESFHGAAEILNTSQPAVSRGIRDLETILDHPLFFRSRKSQTQLTPFGREIRSAAEQILAGVDAFAHAVVDAQAEDEVLGPLTIGTKQALAESAVPLVLKKLASRYPRLEVRMRTRGGEGLMAMLQSGEIELALTHRRERIQAMEFLPLFKRRRMIVAPKGHPLHRAARLTASAIAACPIVLPERRGSTAMDVISILSRFAPKKQLSIPIEVMGAETRSRYVSEGWGIAIVEEGRDSTLARGLATRLIPTSILPARMVGIYRMRDRYLSRGAAAFHEICKESFLNTQKGKTQR